MEAGNGTEVAQIALGRQVVELTINGQPPRLLRLGEFLADNAELDQRVRHYIIGAILSHEPVYGGGGAEPEWTLRRLEGVAACRHGLIG